MLLYLCRSGLFGVIAVGLLAAGCTTVSQDELQAEAEKNLADPAKRLTVMVTSDPSGAAVFGIKEGSGLFFQDPDPGKYLGKTPLTLSYTRVKRVVFGTAPDETLDMKELDATPINPPQTYLAFQCMVIKDGYKKAILKEVIEENREGDDVLGRARLKSLDSGTKKTVVAKLEKADTTHRILRVVELEKGSPPAEKVVTAKAIPKSGLVTITSTPDSAEVFVNGAFMGNTPCKLPLTEGDSVVEVKMDGYTPYKRTINVLAGATLTLKAALKK